jgi:branched-chain amino acid transport system permease protein
MSSYVLHVLAESCILSAVAVSLNLLAGYSGLVSLGQLTFYGIGAYSAALVASNPSLGYPLAWVIALGVSSGLAYLQCALTVKLKDDEFAIATFAMHVVFWIVLMNCVSITRGPLGISNIPSIRLFSIRFDDPGSFCFLAAGLLILAQLVIWRLRSAPFGLRMKMMRDSEDLAENYGRDVWQFRRSVWIVAALIAAAAGLLQASYISYVNPVSFSGMESTVLLAVVILGGLGTFWGPVFGAFIVTIVPELLRFVGFPTAQAANIRQILLGGILVIAMFRGEAGRRLALPVPEQDA